eukprot:scaffold18417_cov79-Skeletonema_dohrnii-CCMP3373.AAC.2
MRGRERRRQCAWAVCHWPTRLVRSDFQQHALLLETNLELVDTERTGLSRSASPQDFTTNYLHTLRSVSVPAVLISISTSAT